MKSHIAPEADPGLEDLEAYISWYIRYSDELGVLREAYKYYLEPFIAESTRAALALLDKFHDGDSLYNWATEEWDRYEKEVLPAVNKVVRTHSPSKSLHDSSTRRFMNLVIAREVIRKANEPD